MTGKESATADEILPPHRPDVPGLRFRHFHAPDDFAGMAAANQATRDAAGQEEVITAESMARDYARHINWDPVADTVIAERDGRIVGYARTQWRDHTDGKRAFTTIVILEPAQRGTGIAEAMLGWAEARLVAIARAIPPAVRRPGTLQTFTLGNEMEIAGGVRGLIDPAENAHHGRERGLLDGVFTRRPWRRRGLARALIARALVRLRDHGMTSAYLGVDGLNPNQAMDLYGSLGFAIVSTTYDWAKPLPADIAVGTTENDR